MIVAIANQKGGVAKTTSTISLGGLLVEISSCLVIDLDPQTNRTIGLGVEVQSGQLTTYNVITEQADVLEAVIPTKSGLSLLPLLSTADVQRVNGVKPKGERFTRGSFTFVRSGKIGIGQRGGS